MVRVKQAGRASTAVVVVVPSVVGNSWNMSGRASTTVVVVDWCVAHRSQSVPFDLWGFAEWHGRFCSKGKERGAFWLSSLPMGLHGASCF